MERFYKRHSRGSSLVFVIIAVAFVGILGSILLNVTLINVETKGTDRTVKKSFYSTESVMDKLHISMENISESAMKKAYVELMGNYTGDVMNTTDQSAIQRSFAENYINNLLLELTDGSVSLSVDAVDSTKRNLIGAKYDITKIKTQLERDFSTEDTNYIATKAGDPNLIEVSFEGSGVDVERALILKDIKVKYYENRDGSNKDSEIATWITTDIKFSVPILRFEGGGTYPNFTEYAIIGDDEVKTTGSASTVTVDGSLYAGYHGFNVAPLADVTVKRKSANIITRGDVSVKQSGTLTLGENTSLVNVYAKNYRTESTNNSSTQPAGLNVYANSYIMDDLSLDAPYSDVYFGGENASYFGYTFNKDNTEDSATTLDSGYSSAIVINGKYSSLQMDGDMSSILLGGRAYISREKQTEMSLDKKDILMGESLSVKSDQNFYLVSQDYMKEGYTNPMSWGQYQAKAASDGIDPGKWNVLTTAATRRTSAIGKLLKSGSPVVPYVYDISGTDANAAMIYFYYNFKSQEAADTFFDTMCDKNEVKTKITSSDYLQFGQTGIKEMGISISSNIALFASGNYMTYSSSGSSPGTFKTYEKTIKEGDAAKLKQESIDYAITYKSLEMSLGTKNKSKYDSTYDGSDGTNGYGMTQDMLEGNQIFDSIMTKESGSSEHAFVNDALMDPGGTGYDKTINGAKVKAVPVDVDGTKVWAIFVVSTGTRDGSETPISLDSVLAGISYSESGGTTLTYDRTNHAALVVSNCNINVDANMRGLVISDNKIDLSNHITITAEPVLLRGMFRKQRALEGSKDKKERFITYFLDFSGFTAGADSGSSESVVDISRYITYSNWQKNND